MGGIASNGHMIVYSCMVRAGIHMGSSQVASSNLKIGEWPLPYEHANPMADIYARHMAYVRCATKYKQ